MSDLTMQEMKELQVELDQIGEDFADLEDVFGKQAFGFAGVESASEPLAALDAELENSGLIGDTPQLAMASQMNIMALADGEIDAQSLDLQGWFPNPINWIKKKAAKIIRKIVVLVKKYAKYAKCIPAVTKAVALFKAKKYGSALKQAYSAYTCIKNT
ncbi:MAG: hypothetical protein BA863_06130 [Desulfovibrio sp. S3730MH75]|nr:MAG: hypothetical protein BA863_06130 [Desulfovibrio sp. S3730MH75]